MTEEATAEVRLAEYASLRQEIAQRSALQQALVALNLTVVAAITGIVVSNRDLAELFVVVALASSTFGLLWLDHHLNIHLIADYLRNELWQWTPSWERSLRQDEKPLWWRMVYVAVMLSVFVVVAAAGLVISAGEFDGSTEILWWFGVALAGLNGFAFAALFARGPGKAK